MCSKTEGYDPRYNQSAQQAVEGLSPSNESHTTYELKQKREYLLRQIVIVQQAIDAVNLANNF